MPFSHVIVWLDHSEAHLMSFNAEQSEGNHIKAHSKQMNQHRKSGTPGSGHPAEDQAYYHDVAKAIAPAKEILIVGPSGAKLALVKHLHKHDPAVADKVVGVETLDHPTDGQLLAFARHYFVAADRMRGDAGLK